MTDAQKINRIVRLLNQANKLIIDVAADAYIGATDYQIGNGHNNQNAIKAGARYRLAKAASVQVASISSVLVELPGVDWTHSEKKSRDTKSRNKQRAR